MMGYWISGAVSLVSYLVWRRDPTERYRAQLKRKLRRAQRRRLHWQRKGRASRWTVWAKREIDLREELRRVST